MKVYLVALKGQVPLYWFGGSYRYTSNPTESVAFPTEEEAAHELATWPQEIRRSHQVVALIFPKDEQPSDFSPEKPDSAGFPTA